MRVFRQLFYPLSLLFPRMGSSAPAVIRISSACTLLTLLLLVLAASCARHAPGGAAALSRQVEAALGGRRALRSVHFMRFDCVILQNGREVTRRSHLWDRKTGRYRFETTQGGVPTVVLLNLNSRQGQAFRGLPPAPVADAQSAVNEALAAIDHDQDWLLGGLRLGERDVVVRDAGAQPVLGQSVPTLAVEFPRPAAGGANAVSHAWIYLDPAQHHPYAWAVSEPGQSGPPAMYRWTRWQKVGRLNLPVRFEQVGGPWVVQFDRVYLPADVGNEVFSSVADPIKEKYYLHGR